MNADVFVNADVIAQGLAGFRPELAAFEAGRIKPHDLVLLAAFGGGFTWGAVLLRW